MTARSTFWGIVGVSSILKLYATSYVAISSIDAPYDYTNFLVHAQSLVAGNWFGPYSNLTLIKGPGFPLYLAAIAKAGVPLPLAHQVVFALAAMAACLSFAPLVRSGRVLGASYVALLFDPFTSCDSSWLLNRSQVMDSFALFAVAGCIGVAVRVRAPLSRLLPWLVLDGFGTAAVLLTREDTVWIVAPNLVALAIVCGFAIRGSTSERTARLVSTLLPILIVVGVRAAIAETNGRFYGWATTVETTSPEFVAAYQSLARIVVPGTNERDYPAPEAARKMAYAVSPQAATIEPYFDPTGSWKATSCSVLGLCDDVSAGWFFWAFREAAAGAGHYTSGESARTFYNELSAEIDAACDARRIGCRQKGLSLAAPLAFADVIPTAKYTLEELWHGLALDHYRAGVPNVPSPFDVADVPLYRSIVGSATYATNVYHGWLLRPRTSSVSIEDPAGADYRSIAFVNSPDLRGAFGGSAEFRDDDLENSRFTIEATCVKACFVDVRSASGSVMKIPLDRNVGAFHRAGVSYQLGDVSVAPAPYVGDSTKVALIAEIANAYQLVVRPWACLAIVMLVVRGVRFVRGKRSPHAIATLLAVAIALGATVAHAAVLGLVSAVSFYALNAEYEIAIPPLIILTLAIVTASDGEALARFVRRTFSRARPSKRIAAS